MRIALAALGLALSAQLACAGDRADFFRRTASLDAPAALSALRYLECTHAATRDAASRDPVSPSSWMVEWAVSEAAGQCASEGKALSDAAGPTQAATLKAMVRRLNAETARQVREGEPVIVIAPAP